MSEKVEHKLFTIPNFITVIGLFLVGVYAYWFISGINTWWIPVLVLAIGASDLLDGLAARVFKQHSYVGKVIDPLRDRLFAAALLVNIVLVTEARSLGTYLFIMLLVLLELAIAGVNYSTVKRTKRPFEVHYLGKLRMAIHSACGFLFVIQEYWGFAFLNPAFGWKPVPVDGTGLLSVMVVASMAAFVAYALKSADA